jgi:hypothetical protein
VIKRFWAKVDKSGGADACWPWTAAKLPAGYGRFGVCKGYVTTAHRIAYELAKGPIQPGLFILHTCDNPPCCNPAHLRAGTHDENMSDMRERSRSRAGSRNVNAKLDEATVLLVRMTHKQTGKTGRALAKFFPDIAPNYICAIVRRAVWRHV